MLNTSELPRLCIIIRDDDDSQCSLDALRQELIRHQLDTGSRGDVFCGLTEEGFNNPTLQQHLNIMGHIDRV